MSLFSDLKEAVLIGAFLSFMIGPVFFMLIQTSILKGFRAAFVFDLGVVLGDISFILIAYYSSKSLLLRIKDHPLLFVVGGSIFIVYGIISLVRKEKDTKETDPELVIPDQSNYIELFIKGFLLNFINIGVLGFWLGMIIVYGTKFGMDEKRIFNFFTLVVLSYLSIDIIKILIAKKLRDKMTPSSIYKMKKIMGIVLLIFGFILLARAFLPKHDLSLPQIQTEQTTISKE